MSNFRAPKHLQGRKKKVSKPQICSDKQAAIDKRLYRSFTRGLETLSRKQLNKIAKKHKVKQFGKTNAGLIKELRVIAKDLSD